MEYYKNTEEAKKAYDEYITGHVQNVIDALELLFTLDIPYVKDNIDKLREICSVHDDSKWSDDEYFPYLHHFYPTNEEEANNEEEYNAAVWHHVRNNRHHWNCKDWTDDENNLVSFDDDVYKLYIIERICDWLAMGYQHSEETPYKWWDENKEGMVMPDWSKDMIEDILHKVPNDYKLSFQITRGNLDESINVEYPKNPKDIIKYEYYNDEGYYVIDLKDGWEDPAGNNYIIEKTKKEAYNILKQCIKILNEQVLNEIKAEQIKKKSKSEDPERINRARNVKTTYIGMSKFGILNFKTTSESRSGYHYQTVEFKDMNYFDNIIKEGRPITPDDVKKAIMNQDVNVWCTDESFAFWAWAHQAYKNDFLYIDDRIPNLKKAIQAPKVNNVRLNGGACKHILSVIDYITKPFVLLAISDDMNKYLNQEETKADIQSDETKNRTDSVSNWTMEDIEDYTGLTKQQIIADISKTMKISPSANKSQIIEDFVKDVLPNENLGLIRDISDKIEQEIDINEESK